MTLSGFYPCPENGLESYAGAIYMFLLIPLTFFYLSRPINRRAIRRHIFGIKYPDEDEVSRLIEERTPYNLTPIWSNIFTAVLRYSAAAVGFQAAAKKETEIFAGILCLCSALSITAGSHMLYSHKTYKASKLYQILTVFFHTLTTQNSIIHWARDHRAHHKFVDTDADPHNAKRGLLFAQVGWEMVERHPEVLKRGRKLDMSDLTSNPLLSFQQRYLYILTPVCYALVWSIPPLFWGESIWVTYFRVLEYPWALIFTLSGFINSWSHYNGERPYNSKITASDGSWFRELISMGSGSHNYHHAFPKDYRSAERHGVGSIAAHAIYFCSLFGLTYDLKTTPKETIENIKNRKHEFKEFEMEY